MLFDTFNEASWSTVYNAEKKTHFDEPLWEEKNLTVKKGKKNWPIYSFSRFLSILFMFLNMFEGLYEVFWFTKYNIKETGPVWCVILGEISKNGKRGQFFCGPPE